MGFESTRQSDIPELSLKVCESNKHLDIRIIQNPSGLSFLLFAYAPFKGHLDLRYKEQDEFLQS